MKSSSWFGPVTFRSVCKCLMVLVFAVFVSLYALHKSVGLCVFENSTLSAPRGIYIASRVGMDDLHVSDLVLVRLPFAVGRLPAGHLLLKHVKGFPGDEYEVTEQALILHGHSYPITHGMEKYGIPYLKKGNYVISDGFYLFLNVVPVSFDGRYLGPLPSEAIAGKAYLLVNYETLYKKYMAVRGWFHAVSL